MEGIPGLELGIGDLTQELLSKPTCSSSACPELCENEEKVGDVNIF